MKPIILTGIRSNDEPTIGNYLGAMLPMVQLQKEKADGHQLNMFVPDLHSFTTPIDHSQLYDNTLKNLKYFIAAGLDLTQPDTYLYRQSYISAHSELTWILDCFTGFGEMSRMTQFKEKSIDNSDMVSVGLFNYPVLMAADILLYGAQWVPVGDDQKQHLEIARDIGARMNHRFGDVFVLPHEWKKQLEFSSRDNGLRIMSLSNPTKKMSKSISDPRGTILLSDDPGVAAKKVMSAVTDTVGAVHFDRNTQPGITNLLQLLAHLEQRSQKEVNQQWEGSERYGDLKKAVATAVEKFLVTFQKQYKSVETDVLIATLERHEAAMSMIANETLLRVQRAVGLRPRA